jgi:hypothetical protein
VSYDHGLRQTFTFAGITNATATVGGIRPPAWARGAAIEDVQAFASVAGVNTSGAMLLQIGVTGSVNKFLQQPLIPVAGLAQWASYGMADVDGGVAGYAPNKAGKGFIDLGAGGDGNLGAAITNLVVNTVAGTGTPAGTLTAQVTIRWF